MPRQSTIAWLFLLAPLAHAIAADAPATRWGREAERRQALVQDVAWFDHEPLAFLLRRGSGLSEDVVSAYERQHDPENIARIAAAGVPDAGNLHFYKGFGLVAERPEIEKTIAAARVAHQHGLNVSVYVGGTVFVETFDQETPAARGWEQRDGQGHPIPYVSTQAYRHYPSMNEPAYRDYLKRVLRIAVEQVHADQIFFDNTMLQPEPESDHGPQAVQAFRAFLRRRYPTPETAFARFGISSAGLLQAPEWDNPATPDALTEIDDPVLQEWVRFRCETLAHYCGDLYDYVKSLNPHVSVGFNLKGLYSFNRLWTNAVYHPLFAGHCDFITFDTGGYNSRLDPATGALISQIRTYRLARELGISCVDDKLGDDLSVATYMAFNYQKPIPGGHAVGGPGMIYASNLITPTFEFFRHYNDRYFTGTTGVADIAVLRTWPSLAYSISADYVPLTLAEQVLIQYKVPFDPLCDEQLDRLDRYHAVILAGQDAISQAVVDRLLRYVRDGGCLIAAPGSGAYDEHRRRRLRLPFAGAQTEGRGRILPLPDIIPSRPRRAVSDGEDNPEMLRRDRAGIFRFGPPQWVLPLNHRAIHEAVLAGLGDHLSVETGAPLTTVLEMLDRPESRETILHFINFDAHSAAGSFPAKVRPGFGGSVKSVRLFSPDRDEPVDLPFSEDGGRVSFTVPEPRVYALIVIAQN